MMTIHEGFDPVRRQHQPYFSSTRSSATSAHSPHPHPSVGGLYPSSQMLTCFPGSQSGRRDLKCLFLGHSDVTTLEAIFPFCCLYFSGEGILLLFSRHKGLQEMESQTRAHTVGQSKLFFPSLLFEHSSVTTVSNRGEAGSCREQG